MNKQTLSTFLFCVSLAGCVMNHEDIPGDWQAANGANKAKITFLESGQFTATNLPHFICETEHIKNDVVKTLTIKKPSFDATGFWHFEKAISGLFLEFVNVTRGNCPEDFGVKLDIDAQNNLVIYDDINDTGTALRFSKSNTKRLTKSGVK